MKRFYLAIFFLVFLASCTISTDSEKIHGNGDIQKQEISIDAFYEIEASGTFQLYFVQDSLWDIEIEAESNILSIIDVYKTGSKLIVEFEDGYSVEPNHPIKITIHHSGIEYAALNGAGGMSLGYIHSSSMEALLSGTGDITGNIECSQIDFIISGNGNVVAEVNCYDLEASVSGVGNFTLKGVTTTGIYTISGVGDVHATDLESKKVWSTISGVGNGWFKVSDELRATISGTGNIYYTGSPVVTSEISGVGKIIRQNK